MVHLFDVDEEDDVDTYVDGTEIISQVSSITFKYYTIMQ